tara:strand:- start:121 stop:723 length:603 start_codon:yes stop_codon:yes gene_type:complete
MKTICIIGNSSLGAYFRYYSVFKQKKFKFIIISSKKIKNKIPSSVKFFYVSNKDNDKFNMESYKILKKFNPEKIILFYTKKINKIIYSNFKTINIHNSFLPNYRGLNAMKRSYKDQVKLVISSSHFVNEKFDSGKIIHQIVTPVKKNNLKYFEKTSFFHRVILLEAAINSKSKNHFSIINNETIISPGLDLKKIDYKFWK